MWIRLLAVEVFKIGGDKGNWRKLPQIQAVFLSLQTVQITQTPAFYY
jgi:hypothetical protein